jgi:predicted regulator of Ras-like GTPase activity (Roadblock/LC7/MglB family)
VASAIACEINENNANHTPIDKQIRSIFKNLNNFSEQIEASSVMSRDGISVASVLSDGVDPDRLGSLCSSLLSLADTTAKELERGKINQLLLEGDKGYVLIIHVGSKAVLGIVTRPKANLGMVFVEANKTASQIYRILP